jgi:hypothetical protein
VGVTTEPKQKTDFRELIPELQNWNRGGKGIDIETWIGCEGDHKHLIGYGRILWPVFIEHDECIFMGDSINEGSYQDEGNLASQTRFSSGKLTVIFRPGKP